jgi:hypothetical protein
MRGAPGLAQRLLHWKERRAKLGPRQGGDRALARRDPERVCPQPQDLRQPTAGACPIAFATSASNVASHVIEDGSAGLVAPTVGRPGGSTQTSIDAPALIHKSSDHLRSSAATERRESATAVKNLPPYSSRQRLPSVKTSRVTGDRTALD